MRASYSLAAALVPGSPRAGAGGLLPVRGRRRCAGAADRPRFLPDGGFRPDAAARARALRHAHRKDRADLRRYRKRNPPGDSAARDRHIIDNIGIPPAVSTWPSATAPRSASRRRHPDRAQARGARLHRRVHRPLRQRLHEKFPDVVFFFEAANITNQILNFGLPAPIDVQVVGRNAAANYEIAQRLAERCAHSGRRRRPHSPGGGLPRNPISTWTAARPGRWA
jgi:hypothetical protein